MHNFNTDKIESSRYFIHSSVIGFKFMFQLFLLVVAFCEAGRIRRGIDHANLQAVYHGHGATSYQNVQIDNHNSIIVPTNYGDPEEIKNLKHYVYHQPIIPIIESHNDIEHYDISDSGNAHIK